MKKQFLTIAVLLIFKLVPGQTPSQSFECHLKQGYQGISENQIIQNVSKLKLENYRLQDQRTTLNFTNGFDIVLLSAKEMKHLNLISDVSSYLVTFPKDYVLPTIAMASDGRIVTIYKPNNRKFKRGK